jgi:purine catabolism regulator
MAGKKLFGYLMVLKSDSSSEETLSIIVEQAIICEPI